MENKENIINNAQTFIKKQDVLKVKKWIDRTLIKKKKELDLLKEGYDR